MLIFREVLVGRELCKTLSRALLANVLTGSRINTKQSAHVEVKRIGMLGIDKGFRYRLVPCTEHFARIIVLCGELIRLLKLTDPLLTSSAGLCNDAILCRAAR